MHFSVRSLNLLWLLFFCSFSLSSSLVSEWKLAKDKNNIQVYTRSSKTSNLKDTKVASTAECSPQKVLKVLLQFEAYSKWIPKCKESRLLKQVSETKFYYYARYAAPWPVSDRDAVVHLEIFHQENGDILCEINGVPDYIEPIKGVIRVPYSQGKWFLTQQQDGKVKLVNQYSTDPGGSVPSWLANTMAVITPFEMMKNLLIQLK